MDINLDDLNSTEVYHTMTQTLVPRPIAWVLSENGSGSYNLAPFSYFTAVCSNPPLIMISVGKKPDGSPKDTRANIEARGDFVVHIAGRDMMEELNESSASLPAEVSEVEELGLKTVPFGDFSLHRLEACRIAYACRLYEIKEIGAAPQTLIFGEVKKVYIDDAVCRSDEKGRVKIDTALLDPLARLGASEYAALGEIINLPRPK